MRIRVISAFVSAAAVMSLGACTYNVPLSAQSGAAEVMSTKATKGSAYIVMSPELSSLGKTVKPGFACGAHSYPIYAGETIRTSLEKTLEGAYSSVSASDSLPTSAQGPIFKFDSVDFDPRIRFIPGFWSVEADANVDLAIRARITTPSGAELLITTFRGQGHATQDGQGCGMGADALSEAMTKAVRSAMENFVDKVINTGALQQATAPQSAQATTTTAK